MNTGVISNRYAKAFLSLTIESGRSKEVYAQVQDILSGKIPETVEKDIDSLIALLKKNGRIPYLKYILFNYCSQYRKWAGIVQPLWKWRHLGQIGKPIEGAPAARM